MLSVLLIIVLLLDAAVTLSESREMVPIQTEVYVSYLYVKYCDVLCSSDLLCL